ncbi:hypothetical protein [Streptomyces sp. NPDC091278]
MANERGEAEGAGPARRALGALPPEKHSLTLRMLVSEIESA